MGLIASASKSNRLLASRRFTSKDLNTSQEAFTSVLDIQSSEVYTQGNLITSSGLPHSGSTQNRSYFQSDSENISLYWYRHRLTKSNVDSDVWFFMNPTGSTTGVTPQLIQDGQQTNFISPKYSISSLANANTEDSTPGYGIKVFKSTSTDSASLDSGDVVSANDYQFDYKTGVMQFNDNKPGSSDIIYVSAYQYVGRTLESGISTSGAVTSSNLLVTGDVISTGANAKISGSSTSTGSFGYLNVDGDAVIGGNLTFGDADTDSVSFGAEISSSIIPDSDSAYDVGSASKNWRYGYIEQLSATHVTASGNVSSSYTSTGSFGRVEATTLEGSSFGSTTATTISGSLGTNASLIRSLTAAGISGSYLGELSSSVYLQNVKSTISGSYLGELSSSVYLQNVKSTISGSWRGELSSSVYLRQVEETVSGSWRGELSSSVYLRQVEETVSGSWRGELSSSALTFAGGGISGSATSTGSFGRLQVAGNSSFTGDLTLGGNIQIGDADTDSITITSDLTSNLIPNADSTYDIGSASKNWRYGYIEQLSATHVTASGNISGSSTSTGSFGRIELDAARFVIDTDSNYTISGSLASSASFGRVEATQFAGDGAELTNVTDPTAIAMALVFGG